ncbi:MAG TPA: CpXC domain-containing protein [Anaerolineales bacterium]|nr:CpXC domain-containing protein [Anaerolineales bacterium]
MPRLQMSCPRCRQPLVAEVEQLFDVGADPDAKQRFLSGNFNVANCPNCGYQGPLSTPIVYHDPEKELLLTYFPPELGLPVNEQERMVGPLITQAVNRLPAEKRKAYLFRPQTMLTLQSMIERVLEGEGITREVMEASQQRINLLQRLINATSTDARQEIIRQESRLVDERLFEILSRLIEASLSSGDQNSARALSALQQEILPMSDAGRKIQAQSEEVQAAVASLQEASQQGLTRDKLLDLMIAAPNETRLATLVSMARAGLDYEFFNILSGRIEKAQGEEQDSLTKLRDRLLEMSQEIDKRMQEQMNASRSVLDELLKADDIEQATTEILPEIDDFFAEALRTELQAAREAGDNDRLKKLQQVVNVLQRASAPPPEIALAEELMGAENEAARREILETNADRINSEFIQMLSTLIGQMEQQGEAEMTQRLQEVYRSALRFSMEANLRK